MRIFPAHLTGVVRFDRNNRGARIRLARGTRPLAGAMSTTKQAAQIHEALTDSTLTSERPPATENTGVTVPGHPGLRPWPKGVSGNPGGRPKGVSLAAMIGELLTDEDARAIIRTAIGMAKLGDEKYFRALIERTDGKVSDKVEVSGDLTLTLAAL